MKKKYIIISIMLSFVILLMGTYAWLTWQSEENTNFTFSLGEVGEALFSGGNEISSSGIGPVLTPEEGVYTEFQILKKTDEDFTVIIDFLPSTLPEELKEESFKYALYSKESEDGTYSLKIEGNFLDKTQGTQFTIIEEEIKNTTYYKLVLYIDGNMSNPIDMQGKNFEGKILVSYESAREIIDMKDKQVESVYYYTDNEQTFIVPENGTYQLEIWGAQGGSYTSDYYGGYGGYSRGTIKLTKDDILYINVGGQGVDLEGGYNGGGNGHDGNYGKAGGGATHIAFSSGLLKDISEDISNLIIVAGGGGGAANRGVGYGDGNGGHAGGYIGNEGESTNNTNTYGYGYGNGGTQTSGGYFVWSGGTYSLSSEQLETSYGSFGEGACNLDTCIYSSGGGGGYYGGGSSFHGGAGGGSGYIGNSLLTNKYMYCYNCDTSDEEDTKTYTTNNSSESPISNYAKQGNGYAKISLLVARLSNLEDKTILLGSEFDVTSDTACVDAGSGCQLVSYQISDAEGNTYENTSSIPEVGTYEIQYIVDDDNQTRYIYYRNLIVTIKQDPTITTDATAVSATVGDTVNLLDGITALDADGTTTLTPTVTVNGTTVSTTSGATTSLGLTSTTNTVVYTVTNSSGNTASLTRTYTINTKSVTQYRKGTQTTTKTEVCGSCACGANGENTCVGCPVCPVTGYDTTTSCSSYGSWTTTYQSGTCVQTRTCTLQPSGSCS